MFVVCFFFCCNWNTIIQNGEYWPSVLPMANSFLPWDRESDEVSKFRNNYKLLKLIWRFSSPKRQLQIKSKNWQKYYQRHNRPWHWVPERINMFKVRVSSFPKHLEPFENCRSGTLQQPQLISISIKSIGSGVFFHASVLCNIENAKFWFNFGYFVANLHTFWYIFTGLY